MERQYQHPSSEEREMIQIERGNGWTLRSIARKLGRDVSTVSREMARNEVAITARKLPGHREGDLIEGAFNRA